jgi:hypothetical protein
LAYLLRNRAYIGEVIHKGQYYPGEQEPIVSRDLFEAVQDELSAKAHSRGTRRVNKSSLLVGLLFDDRGNRMTPTTSNKGGARYRYYTSAALQHSGDIDQTNDAELITSHIERVIVRPGAIEIMRLPLDGEVRLAPIVVPWAPVAVRSWGWMPPVRHDRSGRKAGRGLLKQSRRQSNGWMSCSVAK